MEKILIVEDDEGIADFEKLELEHEGFNVTVAATGRQALEYFEKNPADIILLDVMIPELSGLEVLRRIRKNSNVPIILVTARGETYDKVEGLNAGADDYIAKPFEIEELLARMRAVMRRSSPVNMINAKLVNRNLELYPESMEVYLSGKKIDLSKTEYLMLKCFMNNVGNVISRSEFINKVWGMEHYIDENTVDVYVHSLRSKIDGEAREDYILTVRGAGYKMV